MKPNTSPSPTPAPEISGHFLSFLSSKCEGVTLSELDAELAALVAEVAATGREGKQTYTLTLQRKNQSGIVVIDDLRVTKPKRQKETSFFYCGPGGRLTRNDPNQTSFSFRTVGDDAPSAANTKVAQ